MHGGVDVILNNAGVAARASLEDMSYDHLTRVFDVNLWGVIHGVRAFLPVLRRRPRGHVVNMASITAIVPFTYNGPYNAAKAAVLSLSETLEQELRGSTIRVSCVCPGLIRTRIAQTSPGVVAEDAEYFERRARTSPERAAEVIVRGIERGRARIYVGEDAWVLAIARRLAPRLTLRMVGTASRR
jgi:short-subunit dehydrogenase